MKTRPSSWQRQPSNQKTRMALTMVVSVENEDADGLRDITKVEMKGIAVRLTGEA